jgi:hypothetical protein
MKLATSLSTPMRRINSILSFITVALLLWPTLPVRALTYRNSMGATQHADQISGIVDAVNQSRHSFSLRWTSDGSSYEQTFVVAPTTGFKNGSWTDMKKGAHVKIAGRSDTVETVEFIRVL